MKSILVLFNLVVVSAPSIVGHGDHSHDDKKIQLKNKFVTFLYF